LTPCHLEAALVWLTLLELLRLLLIRRSLA
jgi:hypothetical protein